jgi:predicted nucleic-acid-binding Zn-ribbon protein
MNVLIRKLACPKCGGTLFELYYVQVEKFFPSGNPLTFLMQRCVNCGWETHPRNVEDLRKFLDAVLRGEKVERFIFVDEVGGRE